MPDGGAMESGGVGDPLLLMGTDAAMGAATSESMFHDFFSSQMGGHAMPADAQMAAAAGDAQYGGGMLHDDMVMMPGAMATHDFASFAHGGSGAWGFGL